MSSHPKFGRCDACGEPPVVDPSQDGGQLIPLKACSRCHQVYYHSVECQRQHYNAHKQACRRHVEQRQHRAKNERSIQKSPSTLLPMVHVQHTGNKGRCLTAQRDIQPGEAIQLLSSSQTTTNIQDATQAKCLVPPVLLESRRATHCAVCFREMPLSTSSSQPSSPYPFHTCSSHYQKTSNDCGLAQEAEVIQGVLTNTRIPSIFPTALLVYRLILATTSLPADNHPSSHNADSTTTQCSSSTTLSSSQRTCEQWSTVMDMVGVEDALNSTNDNDNASAHEQAILWTVMALWQETIQIATSDRTVMPLNQSTLILRIQHALARVKANAFSIITQSQDEPNLVVVGTALFESPVYLVNHCCLEPNCLQTFQIGTPGSFPTLSLICNRFIPSGEELTIAYCDFPWDDTTSGTKMDRTLQRQAMLRESYHFHCRCRVCSFI